MPAPDTPIASLPAVDAPPASPVAVNSDRTLSEQAARSESAQKLLAHPRRQAIVETLLILCLFFVYAAWPAPDENEAHYLCKAKQAWNPQWLPGDFFLNTPDAHPVFTWTFGWLTRWLTLPVFAWVGRGLVWAGLAWAWRRLSHALIDRPWYSVLSAGLFLLAGEWATPAGEWVVGGFEAKGPAYVLVLFGLERVARGAWNQAFLLLGAASAFHVLVGGWAAMAAGFAWLVQGSQRPPLKSIAGGLIGGGAIGLLGLLPALALSADPATGSAASGDVLHEANWTYVFWRLPHHLDPAALAAVPGECTVWGAMMVGWVALAIASRGLPAHRRLAGVVAAAVILALIGLTIGVGLRSIGELSAALLRYYWFRLADVLIPLAAALWGATYLARLANHRAMTGLLLICLLGIGVQLGTIMGRRHSAPPRVDDKDVAVYLDWRDICQAARESTPPTARFLTPRDAPTFHWYAERAQVVCWKNIPQDAVSIMEWSRRFRDIYFDRPEESIPRDEVFLCELETEEVQRLAEDYQADYLITQADPPLDLPRVAVNRTFAMYAIRRPVRDAR